nr:MAG TPA: hypothetical protein [Caudoviricetes sp.]
MQRHSIGTLGEAEQWHRTEQLRTAKRRFNRIFL